MAKDQEIAQLRAEVAALRKLVADTRITYNERLSAVEDQYAKSLACIEADARKRQREDHSEITRRYEAALAGIRGALDEAVEEVRRQASDPFVGQLFKIVARKVRR